MEILLKSLGTMMMMMFVFSSVDVDVDVDVPAAFSLGCPCPCHYHPSLYYVFVQFQVSSIHRNESMNRTEPNRNSCLWDLFSIYQKARIRVNEWRMELN